MSEELPEPNDSEAIHAALQEDCQLACATGTERAVCLDIAARQQKGIAKYGTTVAENPLGLRAWLQHAYEECLDQAVYLKRAIDEIDRAPEQKEERV